jgi:hypothetical protein
MGKRVAVIVLLELVLAAAATATSLDRAWTATGPITALAENAASVGSASAWTPTSCEAATVWEPDEKTRLTYRVPGPCPGTSTGRGIAAVAAFDTRAIWLSYVGGNTREWRLWTATPTARRPRLLRFATADAGEPSPIVFGAGEEAMPYALGTRVTVLNGRGGRILSWRAPAPVVSLAEGAHTVGALLSTGHLVLVRITDGNQTADLDYAPGVVRAFRLASVGAIVETAQGIEIRKGARTIGTPIPAGAHLAGFADGQLVYSRGAQIREYYRPDGTDRLLRRVQPPFLVSFDRRGIAWATGRRVCWAVRVNVSPPLRGAPGC